MVHYWVTSIKLYHYNEKIEYSVNKIFFFPMKISLCDVSQAHRELLILWRTYKNSNADLSFLYCYYFFFVLCFCYQIEYITSELKKKRKKKEGNISCIKCFIDKSITKLFLFHTALFKHIEGFRHIYVAVVGCLASSINS